MLGEGMQPRIELDLACQPVMVGNQPAIVVEQYLFGNPAEVAESALQTGKPASWRSLRNGRTYSRRE